MIASLVAAQIAKANRKRNNNKSTENIQKSNLNSSVKNQKENKMHTTYSNLTARKNFKKSKEL
jgi:hypothetical protein